MRATSAHVDYFLSKIGSLCAGNASPDEARDRVEAYIPLLVQEFDAAVFCPECLADVAAQCKFFPAYGELCGHLRAWWRANKPFVPALPAPVIPDREPVTPEVSAVVRALSQKVQAILSEGAATRDAKLAAVAKAPRTHYLSDGQRLLDAEQLAAGGGPGAGAAAMRAEGLRRKLGIQSGQRA